MSLQTGDGYLPPPPPPHLQIHIKEHLWLQLHNGTISMTSLIARMDHIAGINHSFTSRYSPPQSCVVFFLKKKKKSGFLQVVFACAGVLMQYSDAGAARIKHAPGDSCKLKELTKLTQCELRASLTDIVSTNWKSSPKS